MQTEPSTHVLGERLIIVGNLLGALSMAMISIGAILRTQELSEKPMFINPTATTTTTTTNRPVGINPGNYWER